MAADSTGTAEAAVSFGPFRLYPRMRRLEKNGQSIEIGGHALDILCLLVARAGEVVDKRELVKAAWGSVIVGDGSLRQQINRLRKVLDDGSSGYIHNVVGRGYCFVAPVTPRDSQPASIANGALTSELGKLPALPAGMVGRERAVQDISVLLGEWRFVTVVGPGGIGKTTVSVSAGRALVEQFNLVCFVDLGALRDPRLVSSAVASALGLTVSEDPAPGLRVYLKHRKALLILDSCDPVIEAVAPLAESIFLECPQATILASCREPLRAEGEHLYPLAPLEAPVDSDDLTAAQALTFSAVELFVARARAWSPLFELRDSNAAVVAAICRKLDGIPLAIELAAGRVAALGLETTAQLLNSRFALLWQGRRTAIPRHRTLGAALAWSFELLDAREQHALMTLSVFAGAFTLEAAKSVLGSIDVDPDQVTETLVQMVCKSLVHSIQEPAFTYFWLLDATRAYAADLLARTGIHSEVCRRHAMYFCIFLERTYAGSTDFIKGEAWRSHAAYLSNLRAALEWVATQSDRELMSRVAAAASSFLLDLTLLGECSEWAERGLQALEPDMLGSSREMELQAALGLSLMFTRGTTETVGVALERAWYLAESLGDSYNQMRMLGALNFFYGRSGELRRSLELARQASKVAEGLQDPACTAMANWLLGISSHLVGDQLTAVRLGEQALSKPPLSRLVNRVRFGFDDHRIRCLCGWARGLFVLGYPDQALRAVARVVEEAGQLGHTVGLALSLVSTTPVLIWAGDWIHVQQALERIDSHAQQNGLSAYRALGRGLQGYLLIDRGEIQAGVELLQELYQMLHATRYSALMAVFAAPLARGLAQQGRFERALTTIDTEIGRVESEGGSFELPELIRVKAAILMSRGNEDDTDTEALLLRSIELARLQSALAWELRSATTLAQLRIRQGRRKEAGICLSPVYSRFTEGFQTADLAAARATLDLPGVAGTDG